MGGKRQEAICLYMLAVSGPTLVGFPFRRQVELSNLTYANKRVRKSTIVKSRLNRSARSILGENFIYNQAFLEKEWIRCKT
jgi:hypothetical protein